MAWGSSWLLFGGGLQPDSCCWASWWHGASQEQLAGGCDLELGEQCLFPSGYCSHQTSGGVLQLPSSSCSCEMSYRTKEYLYISVTSVKGLVCIISNGL